MKKRGKAHPIKQLSQLQKLIVRHIAIKEEEIVYLRFLEGEPNEENYKEFQRKGVPWSAELIFDRTVDKNIKSSASRALSSLEARGILVLYDSTEGAGIKPRTSHVKLTQLGRQLATDLAAENDYEVPKLSLRMQLHDVQAELKFVEITLDKLRKLRDEYPSDPDDFYRILLPNDNEEEYRKSWEFNIEISEKYLESIKKTLEELRRKQRRR